MSKKGLKLRVLKEETIPKRMVYDPTPQYYSLGRVLARAADQAVRGKGKERHADGNLPFEEQDIVRDAQYCGLAGPIMQIRKKAKESLRLAPDAAIRELMGCIIYAAGAIIAIERMVKANPLEE